MKCGTVYCRKDVLFAHANSQTTDGVWILTEPCKRVHGETPCEIGEALLRILQGSKTGVPHPTSWGGGFAPMLKLAGVKSWRTFTKSTRCVEVALEEALVKLTPTQNMGPGKGFAHIPEATRTAPANDAAEVGNTLLEVIELCS